MKITYLVSKILKDFIPKQVKNIAIRTGFFKRNSKIQVETFFKMITLGLLNEKEITLDLMTEKCYEIQEGLVVTSQAIKNRIDTCTEFLKESLKETFTVLFDALASDTVEPLKALFEDIKIVDSSIIALPDGLKESYKGLGGRNADSSVKLQVIYSAFNQSMIACDLKQGTENDKVYLEEVDTHIQRGELFLADLGYFKTEFLQNLDATNRFFISRLKTNTLFYRLTDQGAYEQVSFDKYVDPTVDTFDQYLYVGQKKFNARVTGIKVPEEVYKERLRKAIKNDPAISAEKKFLLQWNLMITNVTQSQCTIEQIALFYHLRWQIELLFKTLKSTLSLDKMNVGKKDYIEALLYGRLIGTLLTNALYTTLNRTLFKTKGIEVSSQKFYKLIKGKLYKLYTFLGDSILKINSISEELLRIAEKAAFPKRERKITIQQLRLELLSGDW